MTSEQLFQVLAGIDDSFIREAVTEEMPHRGWKAFGLAAATAAVVIGSIWFSNKIVNGPDPTDTPVDLAAPTASAAPTAQPEETGLDPVYIIPPGEDQPPVETPSQEEPTPTQPDVPDAGSGGSGSFWPVIPGGGSTGAIRLPGVVAAYHGEYLHSDTGDYLVFRSAVPGMPVVTQDITGRITNGRFTGSISGFPFGQACYVELQIYEDGSYDLNIYT